MCYIGVMGVSVKRENFNANQLTGGGTLTATVTRLVRQSDGGWTYHVAIKGHSSLPDGRAVAINRRVRVRASQQFGRKPRGRAA